MYPLTIQEAAGVFGYENPDLTLISQVIVDSRQAQPNCLFFALKGTKADGHQFVPDVISQGGYAVVNRDFPSNSQRAIKVADPQAAMEKLAQFLLAKADLPVVAITGSNGKTTTKDFAAAVLGTKFKTHKTKGNYNNELGTALTIFGLEQQHEMVVLEMGMRGRGEISRLAEIAPADAGLITNVLPVHLELLGSLENIAQAKIELLHRLKPRGVAVLNGDDLFLRRMALQVGAVKKFIFFGQNPDNHVRAEKISLDAQGRASFNCVWRGLGLPVALTLPGIHNVSNSLGAIALGLEFGIPLADCIAGLAQVEMTKMRLEIEEGPDGIRIINDAYNASPASMKAALDILAAMKTEGRRVAVLGDMLELGSLTKEAHLHVGHQAAGSVDFLICLGTYGNLIKDGALAGGLTHNQILVFPQVEQAVEKIKDLIQEKDLVLVKASRFLALERIVDELKKGRNQ